MILLFFLNVYRADVWKRKYMTSLVYVFLAYAVFLLLCFFSFFKFKEGMAYFIFFILYALSIYCIQKSNDEIGYLFWSITFNVLMFLCVFIYSYLRELNADFDSNRRKLWKVRAEFLSGASLFTLSFAFIEKYYNLILELNEPIPPLFNLNIPYLDGGFKFKIMIGIVVYSFAIIFLSIALHLKIVIARHDLVEVNRRL